MNDTLEKTDEKVNTGAGDHDKFAHYILKAASLDGLIRIKPAVALCGKEWYPDDIDLKPGEKFPVCPACKDIYEQMKE